MSSTLGKPDGLVCEDGGDLLRMVRMLTAVYKYKF